MLEHFDWRIRHTRFRVNENSKKHAVLFLCTANAARSQIAEGLLRKRAGAHFDVHSAGLKPEAIHPFALRVLDEIGVETVELFPKQVKTFLGKLNVRHAIVLCEHVQSNCPRVFPFAIQQHYWPIEDPRAFSGTESEVFEKFREVRDQIDQKIVTWLRSQGIPCGDLHS